MGKFSDILKGHTKNILNIDEELMKQRLKICEKCPLYIKTVYGWVCDSSRYINPETEETSELDLYGWVKGCGCVIKAKARLKDNHCIINKW